MSCCDCIFSKVLKSFVCTICFSPLNNSRFGDFVDRIYPIELEIKDTTDTDRSASYLDLHLKVDSEGRLRTTKEVISIFPL